MQRRRLLKTALGLPLLAVPTGSLPAEEAFWPAVFAAMPDELAAAAWDPVYRVQVMCRFRRLGERRWRTYQWRYMPERWFSAASVAKLPIALLACERIANLGLDLDARIGLEGPPIGGEWPPDEPAYEALERSLLRIFTVSENPPFNRLYDFLGVEAIHRRLAAMGYPAVRLISRMSPPVRDNGRTRAGTVRAPDGSEAHPFPERNAALPVFPFGRALDGAGFLGDDGVLVPGPHDFSRANFLPLGDALDMLQALVDPASVPIRRRWLIPDAMRRRLLALAALMPRESTDPSYDAAEYYDGYARFLMIGDGQGAKPGGLHLAGKSGQAYGFLSDVAHIREAGVPCECLAAASIYVNADGVFNDDRYEYDSIGYAFLGHLGRTLWSAVRSRLE